MSSTALGAEKEKAIVFISDAHERRSIYFPSRRYRDNKKIK